MFQMSKRWSQAIKHCASSRLFLVETVSCTVIKHGNLKSWRLLPFKRSIATKVKQKCDPYEQDGLPLPVAVVEKLMLTIHNEWKIDNVEAPTSIYRSFLFKK